MQKSYGFTICAWHLIETVMFSTHGNKFKPGIYTRPVMYIIQDNTVTF